MMNKKVMAVAVAGALALPGVALAQVTISGGLRASVYQQSVSNTGNDATNARSVAGIAPNKSEWRVGDNVTQIIFGMREDLGGGLTAVGRYEWRPTLDGAGINGGLLSNGSSATANWVGIESTTMGALRLGSVNVYAGAGGTGGGYTGDRALAFTGNVGIMQQIGYGGALTPNTTAASQVNFGQGRTSNLVLWDSPNWSGFKLSVGWSSNYGNNDADTGANPAAVAATAAAAATATSIGNPAFAASGAASTAPRKGGTMLLAPGYASGPFSMGYVYMKNQVDGLTAVTATAGNPTMNSASILTAATPFGHAFVARDITANKLWATYNLGNGFEVTGVWNKATLTNGYSGTGAQVNATGGNKLADQVKWMLSGKYATGPHTFTLDYTKANSDKIQVAATTGAAGVLGQTGNTGAKQWSASWMYEFSKRTEVGLSYTKLTNDSLAAYAPQDTANAGGGVLGGAGSVLTSATAGNAGETYSIFGANITHKF